MAYRLGEYITYGELYTTSHYGVFGFLVLRTEEGEAGGEHTFVRLELTGDPDPDLQGLHFCFEPEEGAEVKFFRKADHKGLQLRQFGATGTMTAQGWVRTLPCPPEEFMARARLGEPPPTPWKNRLYLEWFGPNGRMVVELAGAMVEVCTRDPEESDESDTGEWEPMPNWAPHPELDGVEPTAGGLQITAIEINGDSDSDINDALSRFELDQDWEWGEATFTQQSFGEEDGEEMGVDHSRERHYSKESGSQPLLKAICGLDTLPRPDELDEVALEDQLKILLGRLALVGVAVHLCDHCTPRDAYRLLINRILPALSRSDEPIKGGGEVRCIMTADYCRTCAAEKTGDFGQAIWN